MARCPHKYVFPGTTIGLDNDVRYLGKPRDPSLCRVPADTPIPGKLLEARDPALLVPSCQYAGRSIEMDMENAMPIGLPNRINLFLNPHGVDQDIFGVFLICPRNDFIA